MVGAFQHGLGVRAWVFLVFQAWGLGSGVWALLLLVVRLLPHPAIRASWGLLSRVSGSVRVLVTCFRDLIAWLIGGLVGLSVVYLG